MSAPAAADAPSPRSNVEAAAPLAPAELATLDWLLSETFDPEGFAEASFLAAAAPAAAPILEVGPRMSFTTAWSANAVSICRACGLGAVSRIEPSRRYLVRCAGGRALSPAEERGFLDLVHDRMTETPYAGPLASFANDAQPAAVERVPLLAEGLPALERINEEMGLAFDEWDLHYYYDMFVKDIGRDPTNVELFDIAQSNSEHSRHWFFKGELNIDGEGVPENLLEIVSQTLAANPGNSVVAFKDNSSAIRGFACEPLLPSAPGTPSPVRPAARDWDLLLTAETHNFPCAVAPYPGAETGAGGRIRDTMATGIGSMTGAATAGYCTGSVGADFNDPPGDPGFAYPEALASPLQILIDASNGASDYGNKFGEPLVQGYTRTFGQRLPSGERREWLKPIMFSGGFGHIDHGHLEKNAPELGWLIVKIGGPAYRIGMGGGAASSVASGSNKAELDFNAVQRGDAEMCQKLYRVVRACAELGPANPIESLHDQGAGGNCNVVKEIIDPAGAEIDIRAIAVGDHTMSVLEIWGAEYQENDCLLLKPEKREMFEAICRRERCITTTIGRINGSGKVVLRDRLNPGDVPVDLDLEKVLGKMPNKSYTLERGAPARAPVAIPGGVGVAEALDRVLKLPSGCSKRVLTTKVDRHVGGLVAQQQCVGPLQIPLADVAVTAQAHTGFTGGAIAIGEQPLKGLVDPRAMARMALGEALTNLVWAQISSLREVKSSVNWMYAAKMGNEGAAMYDAAVALRDAMIELGVAIDGGKDSLSMAAAAGGETVMAPGNLVVSVYAPCPDVTRTVTPDLKLGARGALLLVDLASGHRRLGGSALAQAFGQVGDASPDMDDVAQFHRAFNVTQDLVGEGLIRAGHDVSDGGLVCALLEMAFAGNCGLDVEVPALGGDAFAALFAEELGLVLEVAAEDEARVRAAYGGVDVPCVRLGTSGGSRVEVRVAGEAQVAGSVQELRDAWEDTSFKLERLQSAEECVAAEQAGLKDRTSPEWTLTYAPEYTSPAVMARTDKVKVAVLREEGSNGDREMAAALYAAGMEPWDVSMNDLIQGTVALEDFRGLVFVGGFSYADVMDSAKGWAGTIKFNAALSRAFRNFYARPDTWSLGVCNGCQLMSLLGFVPGPTGYAGELSDLQQPRFVHNASGRFESRWTTVTVGESPAIMLKGMAGSTMGIWCAHGEGRAYFPDPALREELRGMVPLRYAREDGSPTEAYPFNPNGSPDGIAGLTSADGRHLAMMPHPERCFLTWQLPWHPEGVGLEAKGAGPWLKMFQNAREWCEEN